VAKPLILTFEVDRPILNRLMDAFEDKVLKGELTEDEAIDKILEDGSWLILSV